MSVQRHSAVKDVTGRQPVGGGGMRITYQFMKCNHVAHSTGGIFRALVRGGPNVPWVCGACVTAKAANQ